MIKSTYPEREKKFIDKSIKKGLELEPEWIQNKKEKVKPESKLNNSASATLLIYLPSLTASRICYIGLH